ncbi:hypothetical protein EKG37_21295 [Robertmurraya yapensis]|uniref:Uncharacterized protein n=1 Tax=Bacillus yapensis TaxID=2492960 RepID=A0A3S0I6X5_9BACI|nr:hypothetical protein [Bacillus yapensis]RTR26607.1 hypothetical protein EKG37_21295 [Bacillus yapensis]TKS93782.1 hypothetical protein FAR12_21300 [Bacillus yapensis]
MNLQKGQEIAITLRGNDKPIMATFLAWIPNLQVKAQVFLVVEWKGEERKIHDIFIGEINGNKFTA